VTENRNTEMTVIIPNEMVEKMSVDDSSSDSSYTNQRSMPETPSQMRRRKKKKRSTKPLMGATFSDLYKLTGDILGEGSEGRVETCKNVFTGIEYAVKIIEKRPGSYNRSKVLKEIEIYHLCRGQKNIIQLIEFFEEAENFYLIFEKIDGGPLLKHIQKRIFFTEAEASKIIKDLAEAIRHLHHQGVAHRDIKPDNVLCVSHNSPFPVKLCDFDLCSSVSINVSTPQLLTPVGSLEYMAPEVVEAFMVDDYDDDQEELSYNKMCDMWSLGIIMYILLCGYAPFSGNCGLDCGWDRGESCMECQEMLFSNIKDGKVIFPEQHWDRVSLEAKNLILHLLVRDSNTRLDADQVLCHPWIVNGGPTTALQTPTNLQKQSSIKDLEYFANRAIAVNRAVEEDNNSSKRMETAPMDIPGKRGTVSFDLSPLSLSSCSLLQRRRRSKERASKFSSIDELESDFFMRTIC